MASRVYFSNSATGRNTTTSASFQDQVSLTFTPNASKTYAIFWFCVTDYSASSTSGPRLYHDTAATALQTFAVVLKDTTDFYACPGVALYTSGGSPSSQTFKIQYNSDGSATVGCQKAYIVALELSANDLSATTTGTATTTSSTYSTLDSVSPGAGEWIIVSSAAHAHANSASAAQIRVRNTTDSTTLADQLGGESATATAMLPFWSVNEVSLAGSKTYSLQHAESGTGTTSTRERTVLALLKSDFTATYSAENVADSTITGVGSTSPNDRTTLTQTLSAVDYLLLSSFWVTYSSTGNSVRSDLTEDGTALTGTLEREPRGSNMAQGFLALLSPSAASHTYKARWWNERTADTGTIRQANIHLLQVEDSAVAYSLAMSGGSFTLTGGTNTLTAQRKLVTSGGSFSLTGGDTTFRKGFTMVASGGSYSLTGGATSLLAARKLTAAGGSYSLTGGATGLLAGRKIVATGGLFSLTGGDAALTAQRILSAAGGSFALTGGTAGLLAGRLLTATGGTFALTGGDVDFVYVPSAGSIVTGGHFGLLPRKRKWRKVDLETLDQTIRETMRPDLIVLKDGTKVPVYPIDMDDEEILLLL